MFREQRNTMNWRDLKKLIVENQSALCVLMFHLGTMGKNIFIYSWKYLYFGKYCHLLRKI